MRKIKEIALKDLKANAALNIEDLKSIKKIIEKTNINIGQQVEYLLNTGNLISQSGLDLQQVSVFLIIWHHKLSSKKLDIFHLLYRRRVSPLWRKNWITFGTFPISDPFIVALTFRSSERPQFGSYSRSRGASCVLSTLPTARRVDFWTTSRWRVA